MGRKKKEKEEESGAVINKTGGGGTQKVNKGPPRRGWGSKQQTRKETGRVSRPLFGQSRLDRDQAGARNGRRSGVSRSRRGLDRGRNDDGRGLHNGRQCPARRRRREKRRRFSCDGRSAYGALHRERTGISRGRAKKQTSN